MNIYPSHTTNTQPFDEVIYINLMRFPVKLTDGRVFPTSGMVAHVSIEWTKIDNGISIKTITGIKGLPPKTDGVIYIVSETVLENAPADRDDLVTPAIRHPQALKDSLGRITAPCFARITPRPSSSGENKDKRGFFNRVFG